MKKYGLVLWASMLIPVPALFASDMVTVHYSRQGGDYTGWNLWVWDEDLKTPGFEAGSSGADPFGAIYELDLSSAGLAGAKVGILPRRGRWEDKDSPDRFIEDARAGDIYLLEGDAAVYSAPPEIAARITGAWFDGDGEVRVAFNRLVDASFVAALGFYITKDESYFQPVRAGLTGTGTRSRAALVAFDGLGRPDYAGLNEGKYILHARGFDPVKLELGGAMYGPDFYSKLPMGAVTENGVTVIRIFAPKADKAEVLVYSAPGGKPAVSPLAYKGSGVWEKNTGINLEGKYYLLRTDQSGKIYTGLDPYARCAVADGGPSLILADTTPVAPPPVFDLSSAIIYEVHLRDLTTDPFSGVEKKGKYLGAAQEGTRHPGYPEITTGLDHIAELGVNAVHILPFQDFENADSSTAYNWGYMPVNFNSPEGAYASEPRDGSRVRETKAMISAFHRKGLKVLMDVVYNHTAETRSKVYNFNALSMDYYYRVKEDGSYSNGSGCGNEFKTEASMARKFMLDSLLYWMREYKVDGFRFDLMGLMDLDTVNDMVKTLRAENHAVIIYGEPWTAGKTPVRGVKKGGQRAKGFSVFNDNFRDALKGSVFDIRDLGYVQAAKNREAVMKGMRGSVDDFTDGPLETLNYVSCHDNHTLWDRIDLSLPDETLENKVKMDKLANAVVLTSQGVPFLHAGEEFLRTKKGEENSYNLPDEINRLDWTRKKQNYGVFEYYKAMIALRKEHPAFRMKTASEVRENMKFYEELGLKVELPAIGYMLYGNKAGDRWSRITVLVNPLKTPLEFPLPDGSWSKAFDENGIFKGTAQPLSKEFEAPPLSLTVLYQ